MLNLNIGDVVYHAGTKRTIEAAKSVAGRTFFKLSGHAYMVRLDHVKPVIRLTAGVGHTWRPYREYALSQVVKDAYVGAARQWCRDMSIDSDYVKGV